MFDSISEKLTEIISSVRGSGRLTEENISEAVREVRVALLEADVALPVVTEFVETIRRDALGAKVTESLTPGQAFVGLIHTQLVRLLGEASSGLNLRGVTPAPILLCGLQGSGKTTTAAKMALHIKRKLKKNVFLAGCDIHRPAAIEQLAILAKQVGVPHLESDEMGSAAERLRLAKTEAKARLADVLIIDTAGRTTLDREMMDEIRKLHDAAAPAEVLFVVDAMLGQSAVSVAEAFSETLPLTGLVLTKMDGDTRGGAALSAHAVTGVPIKLMGTGEKVSDLDSFHPDRVAARILGMGDVVSLVEQAQEKVDLKKARKLQSRLKKGGKSFTLQDYLDQLDQAENMGGLDFLMEKLPQNVTQGLRNASVDMSQMRRHKAVIRSMTRKERLLPKTIKASQRQRIAKGSGTDVQLVNQVMRNFEQTQKMMSRFSKNPAGMMRMLQGLFG